VLRNPKNKRPANTRFVAESITAARSISLEEIARVTTTTAQTSSSDPTEHEDRHPNWPACSGRAFRHGAALQESAYWRNW